MSEMLLERHNKKLFLHRIFTGDKKWIHYDNSKCKKSYWKPGQAAKSTAKPNMGREGNALYLVGSEGCAVL